MLNPAGYPLLETGRVLIVCLYFIVLRCIVYNFIILYFNTISMIHK